MTRSELQQLGQLLARGGPKWHRYLELARDLWHGRTRPKVAPWSLTHAARIASALMLGPAPMRFSRECPLCPNPPLGQWNGRRTVLTLPDRDISCCARCDTEWISRTDRLWLRPRECQPSPVESFSSAEGAGQAASGGSRVALVQVGVGISNRTALAGAPADLAA